LDARLTTLPCNRIIVAKSKEAKIWRSLLMKAMGSKGAVFANDDDDDVDNDRMINNVEKLME
jgi:hypothetical protein